MPLMFDSIIFRLKSLFGCSATFVYLSLHPLWICYAAWCVYFTVPSGTRGALLFLWEQMCTSGSTFIKNIKPFICHYIILVYTNKEFNCVMVVAMIWSNTLPFQYFWDFNKCLQVIFSQLSFENLGVYLLGAGCFDSKLLKVIS